MSNIVIDIAAEFTGKKAFSNAEKATQKLDQAGKNLGRTLTRTLGTAAVLAFSKASVKAFVEDENAARSLGQTLKNLGLAYGSNAGTVNGFISRLEAQTGVLDDELRPAMDRLLRATGSVTKSLELLGLALDIAAGTGKTVTQVSQSLQKAYLGQTQALGRLGVGLSKAELTSSSFADIQEKLTILFAGQASSAAESYSGQLDKLTVAANNAKETIGRGLVDALIAIGGSGSSAGAVSGIDKLATGIGDTFKNVGLLIEKLKELKPVLLTIGAAAALYFAPITTAIIGVIYLLGQVNKMLDKSLFRQGIIPRGMGNISMTVASQDTQRSDKLAAKAAAAQLSTTKKLTKVQQDQLKLAKAKALFDLQKISIEAALKGKITEEDRIRLLLLRAIANENIDDIEKYTKMLDAVQGKVTDLQDTLAEVYAMDAGNPFISWEIGLDGVQRAIIEINDQSIELTNTLAQNSLAMGLLGGASFAQALSGARYAAQAAQQMGVTGNLGTLPPVTTTTGATTGNTTVTVNVAGTVTAQADLEKAIQDAINSSNASGTSNILAPKTWRGEV